MQTERAKSLSAIIKEREQKLKTLTDKKIDPFLPFPAEVKLANIAHLKENFSQEENKQFNLAGRIISFRDHGALSFMDILQDGQTIQLYLKKDFLQGDQPNALDYDNLSLLDLGDIVLAEGKLVKTKRGEISLQVSKLILLSKSLRPLPAKRAGLKNVELKYRKRYLDLIANPESRELFVKKARFWQAIRNFLEQRGFMGVETPILQTIHGGAEATPFATHHNALDLDVYLRIAPELHLKRLIVGGFSKIYEIGRIFRNEGMDREHLQDYSQMEFYWAYASFDDLLTMIRQLYAYIVKEAFGVTKLAHQGEKLDWSEKNIATADYSEEFKKVTGIDLLEKDEQTLKSNLLAYLEREKLPLGREQTLNRLIDAIYKHKVRPRFIQPTIVINHPTIISPLSKRDPKQPLVSKRAQLVAGGVELCNAYDELNNPLDQKERFIRQVGFREEGDSEAMPYDKDYIEALSHGMPPTVGFGLSERVFSFLADKPIRDCVLFPLVKGK